MRYNIDIMARQLNVPIFSEKHARPASDVKSSWREIVDEVNTHGEVVVTNHSRPEVVVVSIEKFKKMEQALEAVDPMKELRAEWDKRLAWLKKPGAREIMDAAFNATPEELAESANAARRRKS